MEAQPPAIDLAASLEPLAAPVVSAPDQDIEKVLATSGLVMIETSSDKAKNWQPEAPSSETAARPRRKRPAAITTPEEPLVMVETNNK